jgi:hypothetical protein
MQHKCYYDSTITQALFCVRIYSTDKQTITGSKSIRPTDNKITVIQQRLYSIKTVFIQQTRRRTHIPISKSHTGIHESGRQATRFSSTTTPNFSNILHIFWTVYRDIQGGREITVHRFVYNNNNYYYYLLFIVWVYGDFSATLYTCQKNRQDAYFFSLMI